MLQIDPTAAVAPSADLVAWSRLGSSYEPAQLRHAVEVERTLFEFDALIRPMSYLGLYLAGADDRPEYERTRAWLRDNDRFRRDVIDALTGKRPLTPREIPDTSAVPWKSSGWTHNRNVTQMLELLLTRGEVANCRARGTRASVGRPRACLSARRRSLGRGGRTNEERAPARRAAHRQAACEGDAHGARARRRGRRAGRRRRRKGRLACRPGYLDDAFEGRTALLSPFDRLVHDRVRAQELFDFEYTLEMYKPAADRRWGYFALPILHDDRLVGKIDETADRTASVLQVNAIHADVRFTRAMSQAIDAELTELATWLGMDRTGDRRSSKAR